MLQKVKKRLADWKTSHVRVRFIYSSSFIFFFICSRRDKLPESFLYSGCLLSEEISFHMHFLNRRVELIF